MTASLLIACILLDCTGCKYVSCTCHLSVLLLLLQAWQAAEQAKGSPLLPDQRWAAALTCVEQLGDADSALKCDPSQLHAC